MPRLKSKKTIAIEKLQEQANKLREQRHKLIRELDLNEYKLNTINSQIVVIKKT